VYSLPISLDFKVLYYRPDILEEAAGSPEPPRTWDELVNTIKKLKTNGNNGLIMQWGNAGWVGFADFLHQAGGSLYNSDCTQAAINSSEGLKALKFYADLYQQYGASTDIWPDLENSLASGDAALGITGSWQLGLMDSLHPEIAGLWAAAPLPAGPTGEPTTLMMGAVIGLTTTSPNPAVAADFLGSLFTQESMAARITQARSVNYPLIPPGIAYTDLLPLPAERIQVIKDGLKAAKGTPNCPGWEETANIVDQQIQNVIINNQDPQAALDAAALAMNEALK
jgi:multiple sugar transport system substrate-binding protein